MRFQEVATKYRDHGISPLPIKIGKKSPTIMGWQKFCESLPTDDTIEAWARDFPKCGIGLALGDSIDDHHILVALDIDDDAFVDDVNQAVGDYSCAKKGKKGLTIFCRAPKGTVSRKFIAKKNNGDASVTRPTVELLSTRAQTVIPPTIHMDTGKPYRWVGTDIADIDLTKLPLLDQYVMDEIELHLHQFDNKIRELNTMEWKGEGGGGNTHDTCVVAVAAMVSRDWPREIIMRRIIRAKRAACERAGDNYDWPQAEKVIGEWIDSAEKKGMAGSAKKTKIAPEYVAARDWINMMGGQAMVKGIHSNVRVYRDGCWNLISTEALRASIITARLATSLHVIRDTDSMIFLTTYDENFFDYEHDDPASDPFRNRICFMNGTLNLMTMELEEHSPDHRLVHKLDFEWDESAKCPTYDKFIEEILLEDQQHIGLWEEYAGLTLVPDMSYQKLLIMKGQGANGKSTLLNLLMSLHNKDSVSSVSITSLSNERTRTQLAGKLVNISSEESRINTVADDYLKRITGGDPVQLRRLYLEPFDARLQVRFINALNDLPQINDSSYALERRMMILPFQFTVPPEQVNKALPYELHEERQGILVRWIRALTRLRGRTCFDEPTISKAEVRDYLASQDPVRYWMRECQVGPYEDSMPSSELYLHFSNFCEQANLKPTPMHHWGQKLKNMGYDIVFRRIGGKVQRARMLKPGNPTIRDDV